MVCSCATCIVAPICIQTKVWCCIGTPLPAKETLAVKIPRQRHLQVRHDAMSCHRQLAAGIVFWLESARLLRAPHDDIWCPSEGAFCCSEEAPQAVYTPFWSQNNMGPCKRKNSKKPHSIEVKMLTRSLTNYVASRAYCQLLRGSALGTGHSWTAIQLYNCATGKES